MARRRQPRRVIVEEASSLFKRESLVQMSELGPSSQERARLYKDPERVAEQTVEVGGASGDIRSRELS